MTLRIGDRVYHRGAWGNGVIVAIDNNKNRDKYGIEFFWWKYKKMQLHNLNGLLSKNRGVWASEDKIIKTPLPTTRINRISLPGKRSLDRLIRNICELPRTACEADIAINYGVFAHAPYNCFTINRDLMSHKYTQCEVFSNHGVNVPETRCSPFARCIQKPFYSIGGKDINVYHAGDEHYGYFQKRIKKVREFRAHVFLWGEDQVPYIQEKTLPDKSQLTWNKKQGGAFHIVHQPHANKYLLEPDLVSRISKMSVKACKAIRYDMGGVDLGLDENGELFVFEINSRMGLREWSFITYKQMFWELYNIDIDEYKTNRF